MRVALLTPHYPPEIRSVSVLMSQLADDLTALGHTVTVLAPYPPTNVDSASSPSVPAHAGSPVSHAAGQPVDRTRERLRVVRVPVLPFVKVAPTVRAITHFTLAASMAAAGLRQGSHDAILVYSPPLPLALAAEILGRRWRAPFIVNVQDLYPQALIDLGLARGRIVISVLRWLETRAYRRAAAITVHSLGNRNLLVARGVPPDKITVVPNWVDPGPPGPAFGDNPYRRDLGLEGRMVVLFAGVMGYAQDMAVIVEAAAALRDEQDVVFLLVGDGVRRREAETLAHTHGLTNVRFLPFQPLDQYPLLVRAADCCLVTLQSAVATPVVPSKIAGILAASRPVVAALPPGDARALVEGSGGGECVMPGDGTALAEAIRRLARDPARRQALGEAGRRYVEAHFSRATATQAYERLLGEVARSGPALGSAGDWRRSRQQHKS